MLSSLLTTSVHYRRFIFLLIVGLLCVWTILTKFSIPSSGKPAPEPSSIDLDVVLSYYSENTDQVAAQISDLRRLLAARALSHRIIIYSKQPKASINEHLKQNTGADEVRVIPNRGREGGSFLTHILHEYDNRSTPQHVMFSQALIEKPDLAYERLRTGLGSATSFMSLYYYSTCDCGRDTRGEKLYFPRMKEIYSMINSELCPGGGQLCSYAGQFVVSWRQIRANTKARYDHLKWVLEADRDHWIYDDP